MTLHWAHVQWSAYGHWLPGSPKGFRNHEIRSIGSYKNPPPEGLHLGLHRYAKSIMTGDAVFLTPPLRAQLLAAIIEKALAINLRPVCACVAAQHVHIIVQVDHNAVLREVGRLKRHSSHAIRDLIPGRVWAARCHVRWIQSRDHQIEAFRYIIAHGREEEAAVWTFREIRN